MTPLTRRAPLVGALGLVAVAACAGTPAQPRRHCDDPEEARKAVLADASYTLSSFQHAVAAAGVELIEAEAAEAPIEGGLHQAGVPFELGGRQVVARFSVAAPDPRQLGRLADGGVVMIEPIAQVESQRLFELCGCEPGASSGGGAEVPPPTGQPVLVVPPGAVWRGTRRVVYRSRAAASHYDNRRPDGTSCPIPD